MITGHGLVYFAPQGWDGLWRNRHQLMSIFARQNNVAFVEHPLYLRPTLTSLQRRQLGLRHLVRSPLRPISQNLTVFRYPVWAPICGRFGGLTAMVRGSSLRRALRKLQIVYPIVWVSRPTMAPQLKEVPSASLRIYHIVDEYTAYDGVTPSERRWLEERERELIAEVDAVVVVSQELYESKSSLHPHTYIVPNAVNYQAYSDALDETSLPDALGAIREPRLGYIGLIGDRLDLDMLYGLAREQPQWSLVFLGEARPSEKKGTWDAMQALPNVHYLGSVPASEVPYYVKGFQVGLLPYTRDRQAQYVSPLKLYDYLAAGIPVASMDIPAVRAFGAHIHIAVHAPEFVHATRDALADTSPERWMTRRRIAAQHTWEARVEELSEIIERHITARAGLPREGHDG